MANEKLTPKEIISYLREKELTILEAYIPHFYGEKGTPFHSGEGMVIIAQKKEGGDKLIIRDKGDRPALQSRLSGSV